MIGDKGEDGGHLQDNGEKMDVLDQIGKEIIFLRRGCQLIGAELHEPPRHLVGGEAVFRGFQAEEELLLVEGEELHHSLSLA